MSLDQARARASQLWCSPLSRGLAWIGVNGSCCVGYTDGEFRYFMGKGATWEEAFANYEERKRKEQP